MAAEPTIGWYKDALDRELRSPGGLVGRYCNHLARSIAMEASNIANETLERRTGRLAGSYHVRVDRTADGAVFTVYSTVRDQHPRRRVSYAGVMEFGSMAHVIRPRNPKSMLVFYVNGRKIVTRSVKHPGTKPYRILERAAQRVMTRL